MTSFWKLNQQIGAQFLTLLFLSVCDVMCVCVHNFLSNDNYKMIFLGVRFSFAVFIESRVTYFHDCLQDLT